VFEEFSTPTSGGCSEPPYYKDPFYHEVYSPNTNIVTGTVLDQENNPIKDAVVFAQTRLADPPGKDPKFYPFYTFTDDNGLFSLTPYDYDSASPNYNTIECLTISATVCSRFLKANWGNYGGVDSGQIYHIVKFDLNDEESFEDLTIYGNENIVLQAWDELSLTDVEVQQNATCEVKARTEVVVNQQLTAANGSETWIHIGTPFIPCDSISLFPDTTYKSILNDNLIEEIAIKRIMLNFTTVHRAFDILVYPNPGSGLVNIDIQSSSPQEDLSLSIYETFGKMILTSKLNNKKSTIDISSLAKGLYIIHVSNDNYQVAKKILIQ